MHWQLKLGNIWMFKFYIASHWEIRADFECGVSQASGMTSNTKMFRIFSHLTGTWITLILVKPTACKKPFLIIDQFFNESEFERLKSVRNMRYRNKGQTKYTLNHKHLNYLTSDVRAHRARKQRIFRLELPINFVSNFIISLTGLNFDAIKVACTCVWELDVCNRFLGLFQSIYLFLPQKKVVVCSMCCE